MFYLIKDARFWDFSYAAIRTTTGKLFREQSKFFVTGRALGFQELYEENLKENLKSVLSCQFDILI